MKSKTIDIFIAYSREDIEYLDQLKRYIKPIERRSNVNIWYDGEINPGAVWEEQIKLHLHKSNIVLLLVSANSISSEYFYETEVKDALKRHENNQTIVIPLILKNCPWNLTPLFELQALPKNGKPITKWDDEADAYMSIINNIEIIIKRIEKEKTTNKSQTNNSNEELSKVNKEVKIINSKEQIESTISVQEEPVRNKYFSRLSKFLSKYKIILLTLVIISVSTYSYIRYSLNQSVKAFEQKYNKPITKVNQSDISSILFEKREFNFGTISEGEKVTHKYKFKNTGDELLLISNAKASCGCVVPSWPKEAIYPGKTGIISVQFDSKAKGKIGGTLQSKRITITANTDPPNTYLTIEGIVKK